MLSGCGEQCLKHRSENTEPTTSGLWSRMEKAFIQFLGNIFGITSFLFKPFHVEPFNWSSLWRIKRVSGRWDWKAPSREFLWKTTMLLKLRKFFITPCLGKYIVSINANRSRKEVHRSPAMILLYPFPHLLIGIYEYQADINMRKSGEAVKDSGLGHNCSTTAKGNMGPWNSMVCSGMESAREWGRLEGTDQIMIRPA